MGLGPPRKWVGKEKESEDDLHRPYFEGSGEAVSESDARKQGANSPEGIICGPGEGRTRGGITFKATGEQTGGSIGLIEATTPRGPGHLAMFTTAVMSCSTSSRGSSSSWWGSAK